MIAKFKIRLSPLYSRMTLLGLVILSVIVARAGPFGSAGSAQTFQLFLFWALVILISTHLSVFCSTVIDHFVPTRNPLAIDLTQVAMMTMLFSPALWLLVLVLLNPSSKAFPEFLHLVQYVVVVSVGVCVLRRVIPGTGAVGYFAKPQATQPNLPRLARRLPKEAQPPILRLTVRDHFVDVVTARATHTIRLRFSDAIEEMDTVDGICTHRSHWVVKSAITGVEREGGRVLLRLSNGDLVPVSRKYKPGLQEAGLIL